MALVPLQASEGGQGGPRRILKILAKKGYFLSFEWKKTNFTTFALTYKNFGKNPQLPPWKKTSDAHAYVAVMKRRIRPIAPISKGQLYGHVICRFFPWKHSTVGCIYSESFGA